MFPVIVPAEFPMLAVPLASDFRVKVPLFVMLPLFSIVDVELMFSVLVKGMVKVLPLSIISLVLLQEIVQSAPIVGVALFLTLKY